MGKVQMGTGAVWWAVWAKISSDPNKEGKTAVEHSWPLQTNILWMTLALYWSLIRAFLFLAIFFSALCSHSWLPPTHRDFVDKLGITQNILHGMQFFLVSSNLSAEHVFYSSAGQNSEFKNGTFPFLSMNLNKKCIIDKNITTFITESIKIVIFSFYIWNELLNIN